MLININNNTPVGKVNISNPKRKLEFLEQNPNYIESDFNFIEDLNLYEYNDTTFSLIDGWEQIKSHRLEAERVANLPTFEELQQSMITTLHRTFDDLYNNYLTSYPNAEIASFPTKQKEAMAWNLDNTTPTPTIDAMVQNNPTKRAELLYAVLAKVTYLAEQEGEMVAKRDAIKACENQNDLDILLNV